MAFTLAQVRPLLNQTELALFQASRRNELGTLTARQLTSKITRSRALRDKYRDLHQRQAVATRTQPAAQRSRFGDDNARTARKGEILAEVLTRFEDRLATLQAGEPVSAPAPATAPGRRKANGQGGAGAGAGAGVGAGADLPMRGATSTRKRDIARKDRAAQQAGLAAVAERSAAAEPRPKARRSAPLPAPTLELRAAVKDALDAKQAAEAPAGPRPKTRRGSADPALAVAPTTMPAVAEHRLNPLKAAPVNQKIHASARSRMKAFQAGRDGR